VELWFQRPDPLINPPYFFLIIRVSALILIKFSLSERWDGVMWTGLVWLRIGTGGELL
jgi:hypothetical protein